MAVFVLYTAMLPGCGADNDIALDDEPVLTVTAAELIEAHNARAAKLQQINAYGVIELRWTDDDGKHYAQGDAELWIQQPSRSALRIDKEGEVLLWLGSDDQSWWLFDLTSDPRTLYTDALQSELDTGGLAIGPVHPLTLLDLIGITPVQPADAETVEIDAATGQLLLRVIGQRGPLHLRFSRQSKVLVGVETLDEAGQAIATSVLREPASVRIAGTNLLNWPKMATSINITSTASEGSVLLALNNDMSAAVDKELLGRVFNLDMLKRALEPQQINGPANTQPELSEH